MPGSASCGKLFGNTGGTETGSNNESESCIKPDPSSCGNMFGNTGGPDKSEATMSLRHASCLGPAFSGKMFGALVYPRPQSLYDSVTSVSCMYH